MPSTVAVEQMLQRGCVLRAGALEPKDALNDARGVRLRRSRTHN
jgi:hypothetical protein